MLSRRAPVSPEDDRRDGFSVRQDIYVCWRGECGEVEVIGCRRGPKLGNLGRERDRVANFNRSEVGGRGREDHDTNRHGFVSDFFTPEPERGGPLGRDEIGGRSEVNETQYLCRNKAGDVAQSPPIVAGKE